MKEFILYFLLTYSAIMLIAWPIYVFYDLFKWHEVEWFNRLMKKSTDRGSRKNPPKRQ